MGRKVREKEEIDGQKKRGKEGERRKEILQFEITFGDYHLIYLYFKTSILLLLWVLATKICKLYIV